MSAPTERRMPARVTEEDGELADLLRFASLADPARPFAVSAAATLGLADRLDGTAEQAAAALSLAPRATRNLLRLLSALGLCTDEAGSRFVAGAALRHLRRDHTCSLRAAYSLFRADIRAWGRLEYALR